MVAEILEKREEEPIKVELRPLNEQDIPKTAEIFAKAFNSGNVNETWTQESAEKYITYLFKRQPDLFFVATKNAEIVGGITATIKPWCTGPKLFDPELFINPSSQNQGIAKSLMTKLIEESISKHKISEVEIALYTKNIFPQTWYKKIGFKENHWNLFTGNAGDALAKLKGTKKP